MGRFFGKGPGERDRHTIWGRESTVTFTKNRMGAALGDLGGSGDAAISACAGQRGTKAGGRAWSGLKGPGKRGGLTISAERIPVRPKSGLERLLLKKNS